VIRSQKDKRYGRIRELERKIKQKIDILDFNAILTEFEELNKELEKAAKVVQKEGLPVAYVRTIFILETLTGSLTSEQKKKFSATNSKSFNTLKHKLKKNNLNYEKDLEEFKKVVSMFFY